MLGITYFISVLRSSRYAVAATTPPNTLMAINQSPTISSKGQKRYDTCLLRVLPGTQWTSSYENVSGAGSLHTRQAAHLSATFCSQGKQHLTKQNHKGSATAETELRHWSEVLESSVREMIYLTEVNQYQMLTTSA